MLQRFGPLSEHPQNLTSPSCQHRHAASSSYPSIKYKTFAKLLRCRWRCSDGSQRSRPHPTRLLSCQQQPLETISCYLDSPCLIITVSFFCTVSVPWKQIGATLATRLELARRSKRWLRLLSAERPKAQDIAADMRPALALDFTQSD
jgi:hypothetical protein